MSLQMVDADNNFIAVSGIATPAFSVLAWIKKDAIGDACRVINGTGSFSWLLISATDTIWGFSYISEGTNGIIKSVGTLGTGWEHIAMTSTGTDAGNRKLYLNGVEDVDSGGDITGDVTSNAVIDSISHAAASGTDGRLAEVSWWNKALSAEEIVYHMHRQLIGGESGLVGYWPINDAGLGTSVPIKDLTGGGNNGVMNGFTGNPWADGPPIILGRAA